LNALTPQNAFAVPASSKFAGQPVESMSDGIQQGFGIIGYKGKVWSIRYRGNENVLMRADGDGAMNSIEVVILRASGHVSKIWYENGYTEGSNAAPDCFSTNGVTPDGGSKKKQSNACAVCPMNQWGARITPSGKQGKACSDSKRLAVVPLGDLNNAAYGGPLLLRVPAASLRELAGLDDKMKSRGYQYYTYATRIAFDTAEAYPKFIFGAIRPLNDDEADTVLALRDTRQVTTILAEGSEMPALAAPVAAAPEPIFEQAPPAPAPKPAPAPSNHSTPEPVKAPAPSGFGGGMVAAAPVAKPAPAPVQAAAPLPQVEVISDFEASLDAALDELLPDVA
jgi:hypothetical protein